VDNGGIQEPPKFATAENELGRFRTLDPKEYPHTAVTIQKGDSTPVMA
jgi:hypothetical protein